MISVMTTRHAPATNRQPRWMTSIARIYCAFIHCPRIDIDPARPRESSCEFFDFSRVAIKLPPHPEEPAAALAEAGVSKDGIGRGARPRPARRHAAHGSSG